MNEIMVQLTLDLIRSLTCKTQLSKVKLTTKKENSWRNLNVCRPAKKEKKVYTHIWYHGNIECSSYPSWSVAVASGPDNCRNFFLVQLMNQRTYSLVFVPFFAAICLIPNKRNVMVLQKVIILIDVVNSDVDGRRIVVPLLGVFCLF